MQTRLAHPIQLFRLSALFILSAASVFIQSCISSSGNLPAAQPIQALPVITLASKPAITYQEYTASVEGSRDIEIRAQVDGYLEKIFVDEGAFVKKGQSLFQINDRPYRERVNNAKANLAMAQAGYANARLNVSKLTPLVENKVISDIQLKAAQSALDAASASIAQARAMAGSAEIDLGYTLIKAPADGYVGRIPFKTGSLAGTNALTVLSEINEVYAYFSMSENDFLRFENYFPGKTINEKLAQMPPVELLLADNSIYSSKGKIQTVSGQFSDGAGTISFRAVFNNKEGLLRSGNTGKVRIPRPVSSTLIVPQAATYELQDKVFVFIVSDSNTVSSVPINVSSSSGNYYLIEKGLTAGTRIVFSGFNRLRDGMPIQPQSISLDSLLAARPM